MNFHLKKIFKKVTIIGCLIPFAFITFAKENAENKKNITSTTNIEFTCSSILEAQAVLSKTISIPCMQGTSSLTADNNIQLIPAFQLSPVSVNGDFQAIWTPIAFFQIIGEGKIGTGWNIPIANGLCINKKTNSTSHDSELVDESFGGAVWSVKGGGLFQFDFAAISPGDWHHIVFQTEHLIYYRAFTGAADGESWVYETDAGENRNGWNYYGSYFIGYQMPWFINLTGILVEEDLYLYTTPDRETWGDNLGRWKFAPIANFKITDNVSATLIIQFQTVRNFKDNTSNYEFYQDRIIDDSNPYSIEFYRAAVSATITL